MKVKELDKYRSWWYEFYTSGHKLIYSTYDHNLDDFIEKYGEVEIEDIRPAAVHGFANVFIDMYNAEE